MDISKKIYFIRHGQTEGNVRGEYSGWNDTKLTQHGEKEIKEKVKEGIYPPVKLHYSSDLSRAIDTHEIIYGNVSPLTKNKNFREIFFGKYEGKTAEEVEKPAFFDYFLSNKLLDQAQGETYEQFLNRVLLAVQIVLKDMDSFNINEASVVAHSGVIKVLKIYYENLDRKDFLNIEVDNGDIVTLVLE